MTNPHHHERATRKRSLTTTFWLPLIAGVMDISAVLLSTLLAYYVRFHSPLAVAIPPSWKPTTHHYIMFGVALGVVYMLVSWSYRDYSTRIRIPLEEEVGRIIRGSLLSMGVVLAAIFFYREFSYSRLVFMMTLAIMIPMLVVARSIFQRVQVALFKQGFGVQRVAIWGEGEVAKRIWRDIEQSRSQGFDLIGALGTPPVEGGNSLGEVQQLSDITRQHQLDMIIMSPPPGLEQQMSAVSKAAEGLPLELLYVPTGVEVSHSRIQITEVGGRPILKLKTLPMSGWRYVVKRALDFLVAAVFLLVFCWLYALIAFLILITSGKPVLYRQARIGMDGREFDMLKFRTMRADAEASSGPVWAKKDDPRTTGLGRFLRRWSLDELPQMWLVLRGYMSLVGPRPERPEFVQEFSTNIPQYLDRHRVKSGMTGWAQVNGLRGSDSTIEERTRFDLYYIENWSLWFDFRILLRTLAAVISGRGAM